MASIRWKNVLVAGSVVTASVLFVRYRIDIAEILSSMRASLPHWRPDEERRIGLIIFVILASCVLIIMKRVIERRNR